MPPISHFEPYLCLAEVTDRSVLITWGGFFFWIAGEHPVDGNGWILIDDDDLDHVVPERKDSIGAKSQPYDKDGAIVRVYDAAGQHLIEEQRAAGVNHCWISGLRADTEYTYKVLVRGKEWAAEGLRDWVDDGDFKGLKLSDRSYDNRFRTRPSVELPAQTKFAVLGDFGRGVHYPTTTEHRQREVANALHRAVDEEGIRFIVTTGDNIYKHKAGHAGGPGKEDDDWFFSFYQPYRYIVNRIPVYPSCGNHDSGEAPLEPSDDREQLNDNFYVEERFSGIQGLASIQKGLFYRIKYGSNIELISIDTSKDSFFGKKRNFEHPANETFLKAAFPSNAGNDSVWRIPFGHHPPFCAGPKYDNNDDVVEKLIEKYCLGAGVRVVFSGHEHNYQYSQIDQLHCFITGGGGDVRLEDIKSDWTEAAHTQAWAKGGHFLIVEISDDILTVRPTGEQLELLSMHKPDGSAFDTTVEITR